MRNKRAFTLVELLVAIAVMSSLLVPVFLIMQYSSRTIYRSTNDILATSLAMSKMEELKSLPYTHLENVLLGLAADDPRAEEYRQSWRYIRGPFEEYPPMPDIAEPSFYSTPNTTFHRYTYLSYFPEPNPDPDDEDFTAMRKRIRIRTQIFWKDRLSATVSVDQQLTFDAIIQDENYIPKPLLRAAGGE
jgi:prepilin-type N-terminal cleavage/methylation domain-containing protein